jgi:site-specific recombinase XerD
MSGGSRTARGARTRCSATSYALRRLQRESVQSPFVFVSERGSPITTAGFARMIERAAAAAGLDLKAHPHMLRHACGYALANKGHDTRAIQGWLGHRSITSTAVYTALAPLAGRRASEKNHAGKVSAWGKVRWPLM